MTSKLEVYNGALRQVRSRKLSSLTENREPRRILDDAWGDGQTTGAVKHCLELGQWTFATRSAQADYSPSAEPLFGYRYVFDKPLDYVRTAAVCTDEYFNTPLLDYSDEAGFWFADLATIYVKWISNDPAFGADLSLWPESFAKMVEAYLANEVVGYLTQSSTVRQEVAAIWEEAKRSASSLDAMNTPTVMLPTGGWVQARAGSGNGRRSRWNGQSL